MHEFLRKCLRVGRSVLLALIAVMLAGLLSGALYLKSDNGQQWLGNKAHQFLTNKLETEVSLDSAAFDLPRSLTLYDLTICDHRNNTLLTTRELDLQFTLYSFDLRSIVFSNIRLEEPHFYGRKYRSDTSFNYSYIIDNAKSDKPKPKEERIFRTLLDGVQINNGQFVLNNYTRKAQPESAHGIDFDRLHFKDLNLRASYLQFIGPRLSADINHLSFQESSGFGIDTFRADVTFHDQTLDFQNLLLQTPRSRISDQVTMNFEDRSALGNNFLDGVDLITQFDSSTISLQDLSYFSSDVARVDKRLHFSGAVRGKVGNFQSEDFRLAFGEQSFFEGAISFNGLPDFSQTFIKLQCDRSRLHIQDFRTFFPDFRPPLNLEKLGLTRFQGNFTGFPSDFVAYGNFQTALGTVRTDLNLKQPSQPKAASYSGKLSLREFDIGTLLEAESELGNITMSGSVEGQGLRLKHLRTNLQAAVPRLNYHGYTYNKIRVEGAITDENFRGTLTADDPALGLDFQGGIDFSKTKPAFDFTADLRHADLFKLNFVKDSLLVDSRINLDFQASNLNDAEGQVSLYNTNVSLANRQLTFDSLNLNSLVQERADTTDFKKLTLASDILDLRLSGGYNLTSLGDIGKMTLNRVVDRQLVPGDSFDRVAEDLNFQLQVHNAAFLMELAQTPLVLEDNTDLSGYINTRTGDLTIEGRIPGFYYKQWSGRNLRLRGSGNQDNIYLQTEIGELKRADSILMTSSQLSVQKTRGDSLQLQAQLNQQQDQVKLNASMLANKRQLQGRLFRSSIRLGDTTWQVRSQPITYTYDSAVEIPQLTLTNARQQITATGAVGGPETQPLRVLFSQVRLANFTQRLFPQYEAFRGTLDGQVMLQDLKTEPHFRGGLIVSPFRVNRDTIGNMRLSATYKPQRQRIQLNAAITRQDQQPTMDLNGYIGFQGENSIYLNGVFQQTRLSLIEGFFSDYVSNLDGTFQSNVTVKGPLDNPSVQGNLDLKQAALTVDYLQTRYRLDDQITFDRGAIRINDLQLKDSQDKVARLNGKITHDNFSNLRADLSMQADNFKVLNTTRADNDVFYGEAYGSGFANFKGPLSNITIDMQMRSEKGTVINLPAAEDGNYEGYEFIHYVNNQQYYDEDFGVSTGGINLNMELEVTPDALVRIIFDPETQDILQGRGQGNLQLNLTQAGNFEMYGNYTVNEGSYLFTALDVVRKRFDLKEGGTISWSGDPLDAQMDIQAAYQVKTSPAPLLPPDAAQNQASPNDVPVEAQLFLTGSIFSPDIELDFELQEGSEAGGNISALNARIRRIKNNEQALNQQVVSLLVMNRFIRSSGFQASEAIGAGSNSLVGDLISNQLTYWVQQFSDEIKYLENVQLGIDYQGRTTTQSGQVSQQQMEVALSTRLFNDRVAISGSMDMQSSSGNIEVKYRLTEDGNARVKVFSRNNNNQVLNSNTQKHGSGIVWQKSFDSWREFFGGSPKQKKAQPGNKQSQPAPADTADKKSPTQKPTSGTSDDQKTGHLPADIKGTLPNRTYGNDAPR